MKKLFIISILLFIIILIPACSQKDVAKTDGVSQTPESPSISKEPEDTDGENAITKIDWFQSGNHWNTLIKSSNNVTERTDKVIGTTKVDDIEYFIVTTTVMANSGKTVVEKPVETNYYRITKDSLENNIKILGGGDRKITYDPPQTILKFPLEKGKTWKWEGTVNKVFKGTVNYTVDGMEEVDIPAGKFKALKITAAAEFSGPDGKIQKSGATQWFVKGIGPVKTVAAILMNDKEEKIVSEMKAYKVEGSKGK